MSRSTRLSSSLMACSTTPRTTRRRLKELTEARGAAHDVLYEEIKASMASRDTEAARSLMEHVPEGYRNVERYRVQCDTYDALCARGVVDRDGAPRVRAALARVLGVEDDDAAGRRQVRRYADALHTQGFTEHLVDTHAPGRGADGRRRAHVARPPGPLPRAREPQHVAAVQGVFRPARGAEAVRAAGLGRPGPEGVRRRRVTGEPSQAGGLWDASFVGKREGASRPSSAARCNRGGREGRVRVRQCLVASKLVGLATV